MSLNWNLEGCPDTSALFVTYTDDFTGEECRKVSGMTEALIFASMVTGLGKSWRLDAEFAPEFYARIKLLERLNGPLAYRPDGNGGLEKWYCSLDDVAAHIGMEVNVSPVSRKAFLENVISRDLDRDAARAKRDLNREVKEA